MPELPEVETTRRGLEPALVGQTIRKIIIREHRLREPVPTSLVREAQQARILALRRRAKILIIDTSCGAILIHLGMSGHLRILKDSEPPHKHDHIDFLLENSDMLRFHDPRRFGFVLWTRTDPLAHSRLIALGPEPLDERFTPQTLYTASRGRRRAVRDFLLDGSVVAGIGNIYANEALFMAGIDPGRAAGRISAARYMRLHAALVEVLTRAIEAGGTTLRDFRKSDGRPGYFQQALLVYGRDGTPCPQCQRPIHRRLLGQRSAFYCSHCQH